MRQQRNYGALNETRRQTDEQQQSETARSDAAAERTTQAGPLRTWTHYGGMVPQQESANRWVRQNHEIKMAANDRPDGARAGEGAQSSQQDQAQDQAELQEARAAVEEARKREAAERARLQERERGGPER